MDRSGRGGRISYVAEIALEAAVAIPPASEKIRAIAHTDRHRVDRRADRADVRGAQSGSVEAIESLYRRHGRRSYGAAYLIVHDSAAAEDIAQEAFLRALRAIDRFDRRRPFGPWLHRIVVNRAIDWARARSLRHEVEARSGAVADTQIDPPAVGAVDLLAGLSPEHRAVIVARHLLGYTPGEIARLLDVPRGTVNSRLRRGLDQLADRLGEEDR
jgi:RNA polymerase sigma-70 factor (ECF subfamily)